MKDRRVALKKILYMMHIDWEFIKQRPQFIAECLSENYQIMVIERVGLRNIFSFNKYKKRKIAPNLFVKGVFLPSMVKLELLERLGIIDLINGLTMLLFIRPNNYDCVYVGSRHTYKLIRLALNKNTSLVYDCMDDESEFPDAKNRLLEHNRTIERKLISRADSIICTSDYLKNKLKERNRIDKEITIVRNAIALPTKEYSDELPEKFKIIEQLRNVILYVGAIAPWFDFDAILYCLQRNPSINVILVGPVHRVIVPDNPRIFSLGACEHKYIYTLMDNADILVMPFVVNELIRSVNPVKLYEYIYSGKPVIASRYGETLNFEDFVFLYSDSEEFNNIVSVLIANNYKNKQTKEIAIKYAKENTWNNRSEQIIEIINRL